MKRGFLALAGFGALAALSGCHIDMWQQPKAKGEQESDFFKDRSASRPFVEGTVPVGGLRLDRPFFEGKGADGKTIAQIPSKAVEMLGGPKEFLERGEQRYQVYCTPCHGRLGDGNGFIAQRGLGYWQKVPVSYNTPAVRKLNDGDIYNAISHGKGVMYGYAARIPDPQDRWAIVGYVRVLQKAQAGSPAAPETSAPVRTEATPESRNGFNALGGAR